MSLGSFKNIINKMFYLIKYIWYVYINRAFAQSAGAEEYTDCISAEGYPPPTSVLGMTQNNLMVMFQ